jgi:hypothetical protein
MEGRGVFTITVLEPTTELMNVNLEFSEGALFPSLVFFFPSEGTFHIADMAEFPADNRNGHLH